MFREFANGLGNQGSIPGQVMPKTQKMLLNIQNNKVWIKSKCINPEKGVVPFPRPWCSSYWKGSLRVDLNYGLPTYIY